jgi:hypothetical protein
MQSSCLRSPGTIDLPALEQHLAKIGWSMSRLESLLEHGISADAKPTIWQIIKPDAVQVRVETARVRAYFPKAKVIKVS